MIYSLSLSSVRNASYVFFFAALLYHQLCWYLTCENANRYPWTRLHPRSSVDSTTPASSGQKFNLKTLIFVAMVIILMVLFLGLVCGIVWLCFWQLELTGNSNATAWLLKHKNNFKKYDTMNRFNRDECILTRRHRSPKNRWLVSIYHWILRRIFMLPISWIRILRAS